MLYDKNETNNPSGLTDAEIKAAVMKVTMANCSSEVDRLLHSMYDEKVMAILLQVLKLEEYGLPKEEAQQMKDEIRNIWLFFNNAVKQTVDQRIYKRIL